MSFNIVPTGRFKKAAKRLSKKYPSLKSELTELHEILTNQPDIGTPLGNNCYKIRLPIRSKGKGKRSGGRVITYLVNSNKEVYLLTIYDKSELDNMDDRTLKNIIQSLTPEI